MWCVVKSSHNIAAWIVREEKEMPLNKLHVPQHLPVETCHAINDLLHDCLVDTCGVNPEDYFCLISRYPPEDMVLHPTFMGTRDPGSTIIIEITLLTGRTENQKEALFQDVRQRLSRINFDPANSIIYLIENKPIDWSFSEAGSIKTVLGL